MPTTDPGKAIASRNATTHGLFARDVVLPSLGEDPDGYRQMEAAWTTQLVPRNLLDRHYIEKIAAASWRLRRLHRWQAQLFEDDTLTEADRLDRLNTVLRHETALHRQINTAVRMLSKEVPQLYERRVRDQVLEDTQISERECRDAIEDEMHVDLETRSRLYRIRKNTEKAMDEWTQAPLDTAPRRADVPASPEDGPAEKCQNELAPAEAPPAEAGDPAPAPLRPAFLERSAGETTEGEAEKCQNEPTPFYHDPRRLTEYLDPDHRHRPSTHPSLTGRGRRSRRS